MILSTERPPVVIPVLFIENDRMISASGFFSLIYEKISDSPSVCVCVSKSKTAAPSSKNASITGLRLVRISPFIAGSNTVPISAQTTQSFPLSSIVSFASEYDFRAISTRSSSESMKGPATAKLSVRIREAPDSI